MRKWWLEVDRYWDIENLKMRPNAAWSAERKARWEAGAPARKAKREEARRHKHAELIGQIEASREGHEKILDLRTYDWIIINTSAGKDSQMMLDVVCRIAHDQGVTDRVVAVHCDLGDVEWPGTKELAEQQARIYGVRFEVVAREQGTILDNVLQKHASYQRRGALDESGRVKNSWPGHGKGRWCTGEHKTAQVRKLMTQLTNESQRGIWGKLTNRPERRIRFLDCLGIRIEESPPRAKKLFGLIEKYGLPFNYDIEAEKDEQSGEVIVEKAKRHVDQWYPIAFHSTQEVWRLIDASGIPYHYCYDRRPGDRKGLSRCSCCFCFFADTDSLVLAAKRLPELAKKYEAVEKRIGRTFKIDTSMSEIIRLAKTVPESELDTGGDWDD